MNSFLKSYLDLIRDCRSLLTTGRTADREEPEQEKKETDLIEAPAPVTTPHIKHSVVSSLDSEELTPQILGFSGVANGQKPFASQKSTRGASKLPEYEGEKPKTQVFTLEAAPPMPSHLQSFDIESLVLKHAPEIVQKKKNCVFLYFDKAHQQFLEDVAKATAKTLMPAIALPYESDQIYADSKITILAAVWNHLPLQSKSLHKLIIRKHAPHFFTLATIDEYRQDQSLKLALWKAIKSLPLHSLPSS